MDDYNYSEKLEFLWVYFWPLEFHLMDGNHGFPEYSPVKDGVIGWFSSLGSFLNGSQFR